MKVLSLILLLITSTAFADKQYNELVKKFNQASSSEVKVFKDVKTRINDLLFDYDLFFAEDVSTLLPGNEKCSTYRKKEGLKYCKQEFMVETMDKICKIYLQDIKSIKINSKANGAKQSAEVITYHQSGYVQECR